MAVGDGDAQGAAAKELDGDSLLGLHRNRGVEVGATHPRVQALGREGVGAGGGWEVFDSARVGSRQESPVGMQRPESRLQDT